MMEDYVEYVGLELPEESGPDDAPNGRAESKPPIVELDLASAGIVSIVWATGYQYDFGWVEFPVFATPASLCRSAASRGARPLLPWLRRMYTVKSALLSEAGVGADAEYLAERIRGKMLTTRDRQ
jgi:putative flavoprotein involved in K+ transport